MTPVVGCRYVGENGLKFSVIVPVEPLKIVMDEVAPPPVALPPPEELEHPATATAATKATPRHRPRRPENRDMSGSLGRIAAVARRCTCAGRAVVSTWA